jgi:hypothetical protein
MVNLVPNFCKEKHGSPGCGQLINSNSQKDFWINSKELKATPNSRSWNGEEKDKLHASVSLIVMRENIVLSH